MPTPSPSLDPDQTLDIVLESLAELVDYELAVVLGVSPEGQLTVRKARGPLYTTQLDGYRIPARALTLTLLEAEQMNSLVEALPKVEITQEVINPNPILFRVLSEVEITQEVALNLLTMAMR